MTLRILTPAACPNGTAKYAVALAIDPQTPPTLPSITSWYPGQASGTEWIQAIVATGTDFTVCNSGCTASSVLVSGSHPAPPGTDTFSITAVNTNVSVVIGSYNGGPSTLPTTFGATGHNTAVFGYDDTAAITSWLITVANAVSGATGYCPPGSYIWNTATTVNWATMNQFYMKIVGAGHAGNFGSSKASAQQGTCEFVTIGPNTALTLNPSGLNDFGGFEIDNISFREGVPGAMANPAAPIYGNLTTGAIFKDLSFSNYENTAGIIIDAGTGGNFAQYNDIIRPLWSDTQSGVVFKGIAADNRIWGGRFFGSRVGGGSVISSLGAGGGVSGGGYTWVFGTNCQYAPVCYSQFDQAGASVQMKAENTYGLTPTGAPPVIGSSGTGTFAVFDGTSIATGYCQHNRIESEQVGFFGLGLFNSANCTGTQVGLFRFSQTTIQYNDNGATPTFTSYAIKVPQAWDTNTTFSGRVLCSITDCPAGVYRVDLYTSLLSQGSTTCTGSTSQGTYIVKLSYTDDTGAKTLQPILISGVSTSQGGGILDAKLFANAYGTGSFILKTNGSTNITYAGLAVACSAGPPLSGPATGNFYLTIQRMTAN